MYNKKNIKSEIEFATSLKLLAESYEEISVRRIRIIRSKVLHLRIFLEKLAEVFYDIKSSHRQKILKYLKKQKHISDTKGKKNDKEDKKELSVLISSDEKLYGSIPSRVFDQFKKEQEKKQSDVMIIGKVGEELFNEHFQGRKYRDFSLSRLSSDKELSYLLSQVMEYESVNVYYSKFINFFIQSPVVSNVTGDTHMLVEESMQSKKTNPESQLIRYDFEPSLDTILEFFHNQVLRSLFLQTLSESELALLASRINEMETASVNIGKYQNTLTREWRKFQHEESSKKQQQRLAGMSLWRK